MLNIVRELWLVLDCREQCIIFLKQKGPQEIPLKTQPTLHDALLLSSTIKLHKECWGAAEY